MPSRIQFAPLITLVFVMVCGCDPTASDVGGHITTASADIAVNLPDEFGDYWYQGKAELTSYDLEQARYGELRQGEAVLIYVTEDFSKSELVKLDDPSGAGDDAVKVMKLNLTKNFVTGIYPYSMMSSIFTPVYESDVPTLKVTTSSQEWCGHTFSSYTWNGSGYDAYRASYFQSEGTGTTRLDDVRLEDEVWNTIRLNPDALPTGEFDMVPGQLFQRLSHTESIPSRVKATLADHEDGIRSYTLAYPGLGRTLSIHFSNAFPFTVEGWEETYRSGFGPDAKPLTTRASRRERIVTDYWTKNSVADESWRARLGLD